MRTVSERTKNPECEMLHTRLVRLHEVLGIEAQVQFWPLPEDNAYGTKYALACWEFGRHFAHETPVLTGDDPVLMYREMERELRAHLEEHIREHQLRIDLATDGLKALLKEHG